MSKGFVHHHGDALSVHFDDGRLNGGFETLQGDFRSLDGREEGRCGGSKATSGFHCKRNKLTSVYDVGDSRVVFGRFFGFAVVVGCIGSCGGRNRQVPVCGCSWVRDGDVEDLGVVTSRCETKISEDRLG